MNEELEARRLTKKQQIAKRRGEVLQEHCRNVLETVAGRAVLWHILSLCRLNASSYHEDVNVTLRFEGRRDVGLELLGLLETVRPHAYNELVHQAKSAQVQEQEENEDDG
jgi:hypothetical protein